MFEFGCFDIDFVNFVDVIVLCLDDFIYVVDILFFDFCISLFNLGIWYLVGNVG